jgi:hypothetical protein
MATRPPVSVVVSVTRVKRNDPRKRLKEFEPALTEELLKFGVKRARFHVPVRTGRLQRSIRRFAPGQYRAHTYYAGYVEYGTQGRMPRYYMAKSRRDINDNFVAISRRVWRRVWRRSGG